MGLLTMKKGEFSRFLFEPQYAYGDLGCPPLIPAFAEILYEVHILDFLDSGQVDDFIELSPVRKSCKRERCTGAKHLVSLLAEIASGLKYSSHLLISFCAFLWIFKILPLQLKMQQPLIND